jgi:hypothetical protein
MVVIRFKVESNSKIINKYYIIICNFKLNIKVYNIYFFNQISIYLHNHYFIFYIGYIVFKIYKNYKNIFISTPQQSQAFNITN